MLPIAIAVIVPVMHRAMRIVAALVMVAQASADITIPWSISSADLEHAIVTGETVCFASLRSEVVVWRI